MLPGRKQAGASEITQSVRRSLRTRKTKRACRLLRGYMGSGPHGPSGGLNFVHALPGWWVVSHEGTHQQGGVRRAWQHSCFGLVQQASASSTVQGHAVLHPRDVPRESLVLDKLVDRLLHALRSTFLMYFKKTKNKSKHVVVYNQSSKVPQLMR